MAIAGTGHVSDRPGGGEVRGADGEANRGSGREQNRQGQLARAIVGAMR